MELIGVDKAERFNAQGFLAISLLENLFRCLIPTRRTQSQPAAREHRDPNRRVSEGHRGYALCPSLTRRVGIARVRLGILKIVEVFPLNSFHR